MSGKIIVFAAPSGGGKSTIINIVKKRFPSLMFSISATSRLPRGEEKDGVEYYFLSHEQFMRKVENNEFIEWEEVYKGSCYGTLKSEMERIWKQNGVVVFDIDVVGATNIKKIYGDSALLIFIMPPSIDELRRRLISRATDSIEAIEKRVAKAQEEISYSKHFDVRIVNDNLDKAVSETSEIIDKFISE